ncbi:hypothetical protein CKO11_12340 [Rhodobacter sp. TJ_12]|nr:hypothetical protein [Rhodobacter sp. TJ_12]
MAKMETASTKSFVRANAKIAQSFKGLEARSGGMTAQVQNQMRMLAFQFNQVGQQFAATGNLMQAAVIQVPDIMGSFGGLAPVLAGGAFALAASFAPALFAATNNAKEAEEQIKKLAAALGDLEAATKAAQQSRFDLLEQFGPEQVTQARQMLDIQRELARVNLARELTAAADMIGKVQLGDLAGKSADEWEAFGRQLQDARAEIESLATAEMSGNMTEAMQDRALALDEFMARSQNYQADLNAVQKMFGATEEEAGKLVASMLRLRDADGPRAQAAAAAELRDRLSEVLGNMDGANEEALKLVEQLLNVEDAALRAAAADIAGAISPAADEAKRLADELGRAVTNAMNLAVQGISSLRQAQINYDFRDDWRGRAAALAREQFDSTTSIPSDAPPEVTAQIEAQRRAFVGAAVATEEYRQRLIEWRKEEAAAARAGKSGSKGRANAYESAIERLIGDTDAANQQIAAMKEITASGRDLRAELEAISEKQKILNSAQRAGIEVTPEMAAQIDALVDAYVDANDELKNMKDIAKTGQSALDDLWGSIIDGSKSGKEAVADLIAQIARVQFTKAIMGIPGMSGFSSWIGGLLTSADGNVFEGGRHLTAYANGGVVSSPTFFPMADGTGLMGEAGPEAIMPLTRIGGKLGVRAAVSQAQPQPVVVHVQASPYFDARVSQVSSANDAQVAMAQQRAMPGAIRDMQMRGTR